jgi:malonyl-CoA O-methyltransferase
MQEEGSSCGKRCSHERQSGSIGRWLFKRVNCNNSSLPLSTSLALRVEQSEFSIISLKLSEFRVTLSSSFGNKTPGSAQTPGSAPIDVQRVRQCFAKPENVVDSQFLRREVAQRMHERLALVKITPQAILDAGCGEGADLAVLHNRFPAAAVIGLDASLAMLATARAQHARAMSSVNRLLTKWLPPNVRPGRGTAPLLAAGSFARMPIQHSAVDLVWSNLALHWHAQPDLVFGEWRRVLRTDGLLMFSCFGPDTFKEVRAAFSAMDAKPHTLPFVDMHDFGDMLVNVGFSTPVMDMETITVTYSSAEKLLADVRSWGGNPLATRRRGLVGRAAWNRMLAAFEQFRRADGKLGLSFEIIYGHAFRPVARTTASGEAIIRLDLRKK